MKYFLQQFRKFKYNKMNRCVVVSSIGRRAYSQGAGATIKPPPSPATPKQSTGINADVPGLSSRVVQKSKGKVGPGAAPDAEYKVPEYYNFGRFSFAEAELEMAKYRCPQPSALKHK